MRRRVLFVSFGIALLFSGSVFAQTLGAVLTPSQEVPPCSGTGSGNATVAFDSTHQNITVTITVANLGSPINAFHIHVGAAGVAGLAPHHADGHKRHGRLRGPYDCLGYPFSRL